MNFWLKKLISAFALPLPIGLLLIALGLLLFLLQRGKQLRVLLVGIGFLIITAFSFYPITQSLLNRLQKQYPPLMQIPNNVTQVVVLGGGISGGKNYPPNLTLGSASLSRLIEGIRLFKLIAKNNPNASLILSGGRVFRSPAVAGKMQNTAVMLGVDRKQITLEDGSRDTREEALFLKKTLSNKSFILVTSAYHMPRSMALFENLGMHPIAAPTQFFGTHDDSIKFYFPTASNLINSDIAIHEYLGIWWSKWQGHIKK